MVHEDRGDFEMKVKGIESDHHGDGAGNRLAGRPHARGPRLLIVTLLLVTLALAAGPPVTAARSDDRDGGQKEAREKDLREARKALRAGKTEKAVSLYRAILDKDAQD